MAVKEKPLTSSSTTSPSSSSSDSVSIECVEPLHFVRKTELLSKPLNCVARHTSTRLSFFFFFLLPLPLGAILAGPNSSRDDRIKIEHWTVGRGRSCSLRPPRTYAFRKCCAKRRAALFTCLISRIFLPLGLAELRALRAGVLDLIF